MGNDYSQQFPGPRGGGGMGHDGMGGLVQRVGDHGGGWPDGLSWMIFALLSALLLIALISLALDAYYRSRPTGAISTLDMRYARGEIDRDAYLQARNDLGAGAPSEATTEVTPSPPRRRRTPPATAS